MDQRRFVLLDRDGVINEDSVDFIKSPEEWHPIAGSLEAIAMLNKQGYEVAVVTNQSGLARGLFDETTLSAIHEKMRRLVSQKGGRIASIYYCPHGPESACDCRKPKSGLLEKFALENTVDLKSVYVVGDSLRDIQAAQAANAKPVLVLTGKGLNTLSNNPKLSIPVFENLYDAAQFILSQQ
jgi:D-glycero-D-manno-heptose 1,7-bisphosphate phosphatase